MEMWSFTPPCIGIEMIHAAGAIAQPQARLNQCAYSPALRQTATRKYRKQSGFTFIETLVVIAIGAILAALAAPSFQTSIDKQRITGAAEAVLADLRWARSEAVVRNRPVCVKFTAGTDWDYTIRLDDCDDGTELKTVEGDGFPSVILSSAVFNGGVGGSVAYTTFLPIRSSNPNNGLVTLQSNHHSSEVSVSPLGRVRICGTMVGYHPCS